MTRWCHSTRSTALCWPKKAWSQAGPMQADRLQPFYVNLMLLLRGCVVQSVARRDMHERQLQVNRSCCRSRFRKIFQCSFASRC